jgi:uncharacterized protein YukE
MTPHQMASWDIAALRRGSAEFTEVAESTRDWVTRGDAIGQRLSAPHAWDGPASEAALSTHRSWLAVAARLNPALVALARGIAEAVGWYDQAQDAAASALRCAATAGIAVGANGVLSQPLGPTASMIRPPRRPSGQPSPRRCRPCSTRRSGWRPAATR